VTIIGRLGKELRFDLPSRRWDETDGGIDVTIARVDGTPGEPEAPSEGDPQPQSEVALAARFKGRMTA
jgi:hypothetical protein